MIPRWLGWIVWRLRGRRPVRLHLEVKQGDPYGTPAEAVEGMLLGRWKGHYVLALPKVIETPTRSVALEGMLEVPAERVIFVQVLS